MMTTNPFPGPLPYRAADRERFFGRDDMAHKLRGSILASRCVTVHGPSGAGKSSLMQAAVLPMLAEKHDARLIRVDSWPEGEEPTKWLASAMHAEFGLGDIPADAIAKEVVFKTARGAARASSRPLVIYLDQLEQLLFTGRTVEETQSFFDCLEELVDMPLRTVRVVLSLREDYLGRFRDRLRDLRRVTEGGFRVGPLNVAELTDAVVQAAAMGEPLQEWSVEEMHGLMLQVRLPGQAASDEAEAQSAYAQIICRALFQERAAGKTIDATEAEPILRGYLESTVADLGPLRDKAERLLEDQLVGADGSRTLRTEKELGRVVAPQELAVILKQLEGAAILRAEEHHGSRYFEIGHDWLARRVFEQRHAREQAQALEREREEARIRLARAGRQRRFYATIAGVSVVIATGATALGLWALAQREQAEAASALAKTAAEAAKSAETKANAKAVEASDARLMAGFRELRNRGDVAAGMKLLHEVQQPNEARGWITLANDALQNGALEVTLRGAQQPFSMAVWSPDGTRIAAGSDDGQVWTWSVTGEGNPISLAIHDKRIASITWSPDGKRLLTASEDGTVRLFDADGKDKPVVFDPKVGPLRNAKFSPDGARFAVLATDMIVRVWQTDGTGPMDIEGHKGELTSIAFLPDGKSLVTTSVDKTARITALNGSRKVVVLSDHKEAVRFAAASPDGAFVVTTSDDKTARISPVSGKGASVVLEGHTDSVVHAAWSPDGTRIATASLDKTARNWAADGKSEAIAFSAEGVSMASVTFRKDGRYLLTKSFDRSIAVWPSTGGKPFVMEAHDGPVATAAWSPDGKRIVSAAGLPTSGSPRDRTVKVWHMEHLESLPRTRKPFFHAASILPTGDRAIAAFDDRSAQLFRLDGYGDTVRFSGHDGWVTNAAASPNGSFILTTSLDKTARIWNADGKGEAIVLRGAEGIVRAGAWSPDGKRVVTGSDDKKARMWKVEGGTLERELSAHTDIVTNVVWSQNGEFVATTSMDHTVQLWRADGSGKPIELKGHRGGVVAAAWNPDGSRIVTASEDFTAQVWNTATGQSLFSFDHDGGVLAVAWSAHGNRIATSSVKNGLRVWNADGSGDPLELAVESPILAMVFVDEGRRIVTVSEDGTNRAFTIDVPTLMKQFDAANRDCLPAEQRVTYLGETLDMAETLHEACERLAKRTPVVVEGQ